MRMFGTFVLALALQLSVSAFAAEKLVTVDIVMNPMGDFKAKTADVKGEAEVKGDEVSAKNIIVDLNTLKTGLELRDKHTKKYLETEKYPEAVLLSATGKDGKGKGRIKIKGVEKDIDGTYKVADGFLNAEFKLNIADFGIKDVTYKGVGVEDVVTLHVSIPVNQKR